MFSCCCLSDAQTHINTKWLFLHTCPKCNQPQGNLKTSLAAKTIENPPNVPTRVLIRNQNKIDVEKHKQCFLTSVLRDPVINPLQLSLHCSPVAVPVPLPISSIHRVPPTRPTQLALCLNNRHCSLLFTICAQSKLWPLQSGASVCR